MVGKVRGGRVQYPKPVSLNGMILPWVTSANHLGHTLHQDCTMDEDARSKRMSFVTDTTDLREMFFWAHPKQIIFAMQVYCTSFYGSMLYDLYGEEANMIFRCWKTALKPAPRERKTREVEFPEKGDSEDQIGQLHWFQH